MLRSIMIASTALVLLLGGCAENTAPGNDRAAEDAPPSAAADLVPASKAVREAEVSAVYPETMTEKEVRKTVRGRICRFTYTGVGDPVLAVEVPKAGAQPGRGVMKLNGKLVELQGESGEGQDMLAGETVMQADGLRAAVAPDQESTEAIDNAKQRREAALRFKVEGAEEVGFWGFYTCGEVVEGSATEADPRPREITATSGAEVYEHARCFACHGGLGYGGAGPEFRGHENLSDDKHVIGAILSGPGEMPAFADTLTNEQIAAVSTYIRTNWGNNFGPITPERVVEIRKSRAD